MNNQAQKLFTTGRVATALLIAAIAVALTRALPFLQLSENLLYDLRLTYLSEGTAPSGEILLVGITEETLASLPYRSPLDRRLLAEVVESLVDKGARIIAIDLLFDQPTEADKDEQLRRALTGAAIPVVVASAGVDNRLLPRQLEFLERYTGDLRRGNATMYRQSLDGVVREFPLRVDGDAGRENGLAAEVALAAGVSLPDGERQWIDYRLGPDTGRPRFPLYPAHSVALLPDEWIAGKIVLIGADLEQEDRHATPASRALSLPRGIAGLEIQAQALAQLLDGRQLVVPGLVTVFCLSLLVALLGQGVGIGGRGILFQGAATLLLLALLWLAGIVLFASRATMIELVAPSLALMLASLVSMAMQWRRESANRRFLHGAFARYLAPDFVDRLVENPAWLEVGGERREMTFLFTDLAGFTPLTESLAAEDLVALVNEYLDGSCEIVTRHGGMVANIVGDALFVIFNAPLPLGGHAARAVAAALELDRYCAAFEAARREAGIDFGVTRIGVHTGEGVIGNFGGAQRLEYTAMGDNINTAARLESVNKHLGTRICISESTAGACDGVRFRPVGQLVLKGKSAAVQAYTPVAAESEALIDAYQRAYRMMAAGEPRAGAEFAKLREQWPDDPLIRLHRERLRGGESGDLIVMENK